MTELSLNEVESLAAKVGRGSGFSWGLAEEIGRGARALAQGGFPWADALLALAERAGSLQPPSPPRAERWRRRQSETTASAPLCPVRAAALLIDDPTILRDGPLRLENVGVPLWIAGLLAPSGVGGGFEIAWSGASALVDRLGVIPKAAGGAWLASEADMKISPCSAPTRAPQPLLRPLVADALLTALGAFAARVYVPASESSRAKGAGGGRVDDE